MRASMIVIFSGMTGSEAAGLLLLAFEVFDFLVPAIHLLLGVAPAARQVHLVEHAPQFVGQCVALSGRRVWGGLASGTLGFEAYGGGFAGTGGRLGGSRLGRRGLDLRPGRLRTNRIGQRRG